MTNLALSVCCTILLGLIALACEKAFEGEYVLRTFLLYVFGFSCVTTAFYVLFAVNLGVASALGFFDLPISRGIDDFASVFLPEKETRTAKVCLTLTVIEVTALLFWWSYLNSEREKREKRSCRWRDWE